MSIYARYVYIFFGVLLFIPLLLIASAEGVLLLVVLSVLAFAAAIAGFALIGIAIIAPDRLPGQKKSERPEEVPSS